METEQKNDNSEENQKIILQHPIPLDDNTFEMLVKKDITNNLLQANINIEPEQNSIQIPENILNQLYKKKIYHISEQAVLATLDERTLDAYNSLQEICYFSDKDLLYIQNVEGDNAENVMFTYVKKRLENVSVMKPTLEFIDVVNDAVLCLENDIPNFNSYKASVLIDKMENASKNLINKEGLAVISYISSKLYRKANSNFEIYNNQSVSKEEKEYLHKVLEQSSDYRLISYCQNRLPEKNDQKLIIRAYQRALQKKQSKNNAYKINAALADLYLKRTKKIGFISHNDDISHNSQKALQYLMGAYHFGGKDEKKTALKNMSDVYLRLGNKDEWKKIKEIIAMKFLTKEDRSEALIAIGDKTKDVSYYYMALNETNKNRISQNVKTILLNKIYNRLIQTLPEGDERNSYVQKQKNLEKQNSNFWIVLNSEKEK